jgi:hypothetical protein
MEWAEAIRRQKNWNFDDASVSHDLHIPFGVPLTDSLLLHQGGLRARAGQGFQEARPGVCC